MRNPLLIAPLLLLAAPAFADVTIPRESQRASVTQTIGTTDLTIAYHRPGVKGRSIFGGLVPFGEVWRLGANNATTLTVTDGVTIAGHNVPAGTYALFAIPQPGAWTFILNSDAEQWGSSGYDPAKDVLRVDAKPRPAPHSEWMGFTLTPVGTDAVAVELTWDDLAVGFPISVPVTDLVWAQIDIALAATPDDPKLLGRAASFSVQTGERLEQGLAAIELVQAAKPSHWNLEVKGKILWRLGREAAAIASMEAALAAAKGNAPDEFFRTRGAVLDGWKQRGQHAEP